MPTILTSARARDGAFGLTPAAVRTLLALIVAFGAALRLYGLDRQSLWNDELSSWTEYRLPTVWDVVSRGAPSEHPPAYWVLMHFWTAWFGDSETMLRLPSAIAGIAVIPLMYALANRLYGPREGLLAAALTATAWTPVYFSQEARPYMFLMLLTVLSSNCLIDITRALRDRARLPGPATIGYVVAAELACYVHHFGALLVALQGAFMVLYFLRRPDALGRLAAIYGVLLIAYVPALRRAGAALSTGVAWLQPPEFVRAGAFVRSLFNRSTILTCLVMALSIPLGLTLIRPIRSGEPWRLAQSTDALLLAWLVVPVLIAYVWSQIGRPLFTYRYLIIAAPPAYVLVARAVTQLPVRPVIVTLVAVALPMVLWLHLVFGMGYYSEPSKDQFREAAAYLVGHDTPSAGAVILACAWHRKYFDYYFERLASPRRVDRLAEGGGDRAAIVQLVAERSPRDVWLLAGHKTPDPALVGALTDELQLVGESHFLGADAWHFVPRTPGR